MKPTEVLYAEHRLIERMLHVLDRASRKLELGEPVEMSLFAEAIDFARHYADALHHGKEEDQLIPMMQESGGAEGLIQVILDDHVQGRTYIGNIAQAVDRFSGGDASAKAEIISNTLSYVELLRGHIEREDLSLFPAAEELFETAQKRELQVQFQRVDEAVMGPAGEQRYVDLVARLEQAIG